MNNTSSQSIWNLQGGTGLILTEKKRKPYTLRDKRSDAVYFCAHTGTSMHPTLSELDLLEIKPYGQQPIRAGDVILFLLPRGGHPAVHRVVRISPEGIRTRGDSNDRLDPWVIHSENVIGRVVRAARGRRRRSIYGGMVGRFWSRGVGGLKVLERSLSFFYHRLARSNLIGCLVPLHKWTRIIAVNHADGRELKLILGRWVVGWRRPEGLAWQIRRPFRLFVDERSLPQ